MTNPPAGWYNDPSNPSRQRWFDGTEWTEHLKGDPVAPLPPQDHYSAGPMTSSGINVRREAMYTRQQTPHSLTKWILLSLFLGLPAIGLIYYTVSPNHYWTA